MSVLSAVPDQHVLNGVCPYYTMFPLDFPLARLKDARKGDVVVDPFCGRGSTNFAARVRGLPSLGIDSNPVAAAIAEAKIVATTPGLVAASCREILLNASEPTLPEGEFWDNCYHPFTLAQLCALRETLLLSCDSPARVALRALLLGRLHGPKNKRAPYSYCSNQMPRTYAAKPDYSVRFWRRRRKVAPFVDILELVQRKAVHFFPHKLPGANARIICGDSRTVDIRKHLPTNRRVKWVITSPPYYGMRSYVPDQWLRYWFLGGPDAVPYQFDGQLPHTSPGVFASGLADVWRNVAKASLPDARMVVRFGGIADRDHDPREILRESIRLSDCGWQIMTARDAGTASLGRRQADQFLSTDSQAVREYDFFIRHAA